MLLKMKKTRRAKGNRFLISVTVLGSAGPIRFVANEEESVAAVISSVLKSYAREGRVPALGSDLDSFVLYSPLAGTEALDPSDAIGSVGGRNFVLYRKAEMETAQTEKAIDEQGTGRHERRWGSDTVPAANSASEGSSPVTQYSANSAASETEFVEITLDLQDDDTIILQSVESATVISINGNDVIFGIGRYETSTPASALTSRSPTMRRSASSKLIQFSQKLKAEALVKAKQFSQELRRFLWSHGHASRILFGVGGGAGGGNNGLDSALAARAMRRQRAQPDRTRSGAHKALQGLKFITSVDER